MLLQPSDCSEMLKNLNYHCRDTVTSWHLLAVNCKLVENFQTDKPGVLAVMVITKKSILSEHTSDFCNDGNPSLATTNRCFIKDNFLHFEQKMGFCFFLNILQQNS